MSKPPYRPLNLSQLEIRCLEVLVESAEQNLAVNPQEKVGREVLVHLSSKLKKIKEPGEP